MSDLDLCSDYPVIKAIDAQIEQLQEVRADLEGELGLVNREEESLLEARERIAAALTVDETPVERHQSPPEPPEPVVDPDPEPPKATERGSPGPDTDRAQDQQRRDEAVYNVVAGANEPLSPGVVAEETGLDPMQINHTAKRLEDAGRLVREGEGRWTRYRTGLQPPSRHLITEAAEGIYAYIKSQDGPVRNGEIRKEFKMTSDEVRRRLDVLIADGRIKKTGERSGTRYSISDGDPPPPKPEPRPEPEGRRDQLGKAKKGTPEGRICSALSYSHMTQDELAEHLGEPREYLTPYLGKLMREGEVRTVKSNGRVLYRFVG